MSYVDAGPAAGYFESHTPKADAGRAHCGAKTAEELAAIHERLQAPYLDQLASLGVAREQLRQALGRAGLALCPLLTR